MNNPYTTITLDYANLLRLWMNTTGYKFPETQFSRQHNQLLSAQNINPIQPSIETIILHFGINTDIVKTIKSSKVTATNAAGQIVWNISSDWRSTLLHGEVLCTNERCIVVGHEYEGFLFNRKFTPRIWQFYFQQILRHEQVEYEGYTASNLYGDSWVMTFHMQFPSQYEGTVPFYLQPPITDAEAQDRARLQQQTLELLQWATQQKAAVKDIFFRVIESLVTRRPLPEHQK